MTDELDIQLCEKYPKLFATRHSANSSMFWGFSCSNGWFTIIDLLCQNIQSHIDWKKGECPQVVVAQVKEKFGGLRFYYDGGDDYIRGLVSMAESIADHTCEECGAPGTAGGKGWIKTLCPVHRAESDARYMEGK